MVKRRQLKGYTTDIITDQAVDWLKSRGCLAQGDRSLSSCISRTRRRTPNFSLLPGIAGGIPGARRFLISRRWPTRGIELLEKPGVVRAQRGSWHGVDYMYHGAMEFDQVLSRLHRDNLGAR